MKSRRRQIFLAVSVPLMALGLLAVFLYARGRFAVVNRGAAGAPATSSVAATPTTTSPFTGLPCPNAKSRPLAVMLSEDDAARPLSGITKADLVVEMPVVTGLVNRLMVVYQCESPAEIGSVRSARHDFIPIAAALDSIYAHWGGSHFALEQLNQHVIDNIDALPNPADAFFRKKNIREPHNGFTSSERLLRASRTLGYRTELRDNVGYPHASAGSAQAAGTTTAEAVGQPGDLTIGYPNSFEVRFHYDPQSKQYLRFRDGRAERDKLDASQVAVATVVVMRAVSYQIEGEYNTVKIEGEGQAAFYLNGQEIRGRWQKDRATRESPLKFFDSQGREVLFQPGKIWIAVIEPDRPVTWR
ncbi:DUF3048 domain-containing protein [Candidatus Parcubacteria bacterium]|nr:DUF3048 domain-containing protein [Candidatus Parcubacteria bacterium]